MSFSLDGMFGLELLTTYVLYEWGRYACQKARERRMEKRMKTASRFLRVFNEGYQAGMKHAEESKPLKWIEIRPKTDEELEKEIEESQEKELKKQKKNWCLKCGNEYDRKSTCHICESSREGKQEDKAEVSKDKKELDGLDC